MYAAEMCRADLPRHEPVGGSNIKENEADGISMSRQP
jgi:hypothetical protein